MKNIECEIRSFITKEQFEKLLDFFNKNAESLGDDEQTTYYLSGDADLRIQRNINYSKIWLKKGKIHDEAREEIEIRFARDDFEKLEKLFLALGCEVEIKWFRARNSFKWNDIDVCLDHTRGYGYIIELEKMSGDAAESGSSKGGAIPDFLKSKMAELGVALTPREEFDSKYVYYKENWRKLISESSF
jgi:predicted adenylyl cyclase CyaB